MSLGTCCGNRWATVSEVFRELSRGAAKSAAAKARAAGLLPQDAGAQRRQAVCRTCPTRAVFAGVDYCGKPLLRQVRRSAVDGCGCPIHDKSRAPGEHCPVDCGLRPAAHDAAGRCNCKWCAVEPGQSS